jgi:WD40 repeat protein
MQYGQCVEETLSNGSSIEICKCSSIPIILPTTTKQTTITTTEVVPMVQLTGHTRPVTCLAKISDTEIASGSDDATIKIWNLADHSLKQTLNGHIGPVYALGYVSVGFLVSAGLDKILRVWNVTGGFLKGKHDRTHFNYLCTSNYD